MAANAAVDKRSTWCVRFFFFQHCLDVCEGYSKALFFKSGSILRACKKCRMNGQKLNEFVQMLSESRVPKKNSIHTHLSKLHKQAAQAHAKLQCVFHTCSLLQQAMSRW